MKKRILSGVLVGLFAVGATAQTDGKQALHDSLVKKQFFVRGFSADSEIRWRWDGKSLVEETPKLRTLGVLTVQSVKVKGNKVVVQGERRTLLGSDAKGPTFSKITEHVRVDVDMSGGDVAGLLPKVANLIFYPDMQHALDDLPVEYRGLVAPEDGDSDQRKKDRAKLKLCDCAHPDMATCGSAVAALGMTGMEPPTVVFAPDPEFSEEARQKKFSGNVQVALNVSTKGTAEGLWLARPVGMGLDAKAIQSVSRYKFNPATCHGQAVPVFLFIDVNFQIF